MGWLDRIFGKKQEEKFEEIKMSLKELEDFLSDKLKNDFGPLKDTAKKEYENLQMAASSLGEQLKILERAPYSGKNDPILIRKAVGSRKSFVNKMEKLVKQIQTPMSDKINSILDYHNETAKSINMANAKTVTEYAFLRELFAKESEKIIESFRQISEIDKRLGNSVKKFKDSNLQLIKAKEAVTEISKLTEEMKKRDESDLDKSLKETEDKITKTQNELNELIESNEYKTFLEIQKSVEELKTNLQNKKSDFMQSIAKVEVPLKKYKWSAENKILDDYVQYSFESVLSNDPRGEASTVSTCISILETG